MHFGWDFPIWFVFYKLGGDFQHELFQHKFFQDEFFQHELFQHELLQ